MESVRTNYLLRLQAIVGEETVQYLVHCVHCEMLYTVQNALYTTFVSYYCFNLPYPPAGKISGRFILF